MGKKLIDFIDISKSYNGNTVLDELNLYVRENEFLTLLGPSGCGKTTTLRLLGGFETPDKGKIMFDSKDITNIPANERNLNTVFQKYSLFPHMTIAENIAFGLKLKKKSKEYINDKIKYALKLVNLDGFENRSIDSLSGGQQQRIAIARAIVNEPKVLLLDEPLGALDLKLRQNMQYELIRLKNELGITFVYVTHDQEEAMSISDRIAVMKSGIVQQYEVPQAMYLNPDNLFVAQFLGMPQVNTFSVDVKGGSIYCNGALLRSGCELKDGTYTAGIRPESFEIAQEGITVKASHVRMTGRDLLIHFSIGNTEFRILVHSDLSIKEGDEFTIRARKNQIMIFDTDEKSVGKF